ncbi:6-phosphogluconate dehydrogenase [Aquimarina sp. ERC-38]|uniref:6-phosphogluconate dehydrogenase n=1 Tax=Aquimarina sp. ERC-38 TaxID=2949996 RepID=UPI00224513C2|nr:6-phosphogluconate dehydrogenase [Aquimarina sp. ERC-38]UZO80783.1 6-phosphogluconate dehydrogenase [Aquimarina sp. ERC-38]
MKKVLGIILGTIGLLFLIWFSVIYFATFSKGNRSGELIKFSHKGIIFKTWEGEISQGISGAQIFSFSVEEKHKDVIQKLQEFQGRYVKVEYIERFGKIKWLGDTEYFVTEVEEEASPHIRNR